MNQKPNSNLVLLALCFSIIFSILFAPTIVEAEVFTKEEKLKYAVRILKRSMINRGLVLDEKSVVIRSGQIWEEPEGREGLAKYRLIEAISQTSDLILPGEIDVDTVYFFVKDQEGRMEHAKAYLNSYKSGVNYKTRYYFGVTSSMECSGSPNFLGGGQNCIEIALEYIGPGRQRVKVDFPRFDQMRRTIDQIIALDPKTLGPAMSDLMREYYIGEASFLKTEGTHPDFRLSSSPERAIPAKLGTIFSKANQ